MGVLESAVMHPCKTLQILGPVQQVFSSKKGGGLEGWEHSKAGQKNVGVLSMLELWGIYMGNRRRILFRIQWHMSPDSVESIINVHICMYVTLLGGTIITICNVLCLIYCSTQFFEMCACLCVWGSLSLTICLFVSVWQCVCVCVSVFRCTSPGK